MVTKMKPIEALYDKPAIEKRANVWKGKNCKGVVGFYF